MSPARLTLAFCAAALLGAFAAACGSPTPKCSPVSCSGCCTAAGECVGGNTQAQCGAQGNTCAACAVGSVCEFGLCRTGNTGGGSGGGAMGGGSGGGAMGGGSGGGAVGGGTGGGSTGGGTGGGSTGGGAGGGSTGGGTGGGSTGGGGGSMTFDAGVITLQDGGMLSPPTVRLTFAPNCGTVNRCAGDEVASWYYTAGCIDDAAFDVVTRVAMQAGCTATVTNKDGGIAGSVVFDGNMVHRTAVGQVTYTMTAMGTVCLQLCSSIPGLLPTGISGSCATQGTACVCNLAFDIGQAGSESYTYVDGGLTLGNGETYDSCITGLELRYRETTDGGIKGVFTLNK